MPLNEGVSPRAVLLIISDASYRSALADALRAVGVGPIEVATPMEALDIVDQNAGVDLAVVDISTPPKTLNAVAFARMTKVRNSAARLILAVAQAKDTADLDEHETALFQAIVFKGVDTADVASSILRSLDDLSQQ
jgi:DNA-binding NtrC family response regulator